MGAAVLPKEVWVVLVAFFYFLKKCQNGLRTVTKLKTKKEYSMKRFLAIALIATVGLIYSTGSASAAAGVGNYSNGDAANGVVGSRHNLGAFGMHTIAGASDALGPEDASLLTSNSTSEICVFCHTPHHTNQGSGPLWNRASGNTSFTTYGVTIAGTPDTSGIGPVSVACLSCHDGVTQFDMLVNAPGKGFGSGNSDTNAGFGAIVQGWNFTEKAGGVFGDDHRLSIGAGSDGIAGADLSNDHPIGIPYQTDRASLRPTSTAFVDVVLNATMGKHMMSDRGFDPATFDNGNLAQNKWAINGFISDTATIADLLKGSGDTVECGSCHDPHFNNKSWGEYEGGTLATLEAASDVEGYGGHSNGLFLRRVGGNAGSGVCRTCHNK